MSTVIETNVLAVPSDASISDFVWVHALGQRQPVVPVVDGNRFLGMCSIHDAANVDRAAWADTPVTDIIDISCPVGTPSWTIRDVVAAMGRAGTDLMAVTDNDGGFVGLVRDSEIVKLDAILVETESPEGGPS